MKSCNKLMLLLGFCCLAHNTYSQTIQTMLQQIAALQVYISDAEKGYKIVEGGVQTIGDIKKGEFNLHSTFFNSLMTVSPTVKGIAEVTEIVALESNIIQRFSTAISGYKQTGKFSSAEISYMSGVYTNLLSAGINDLNELNTLLTDQQFGMNDGQRIKRIDAIDQDITRQSEFVNGFTDQADLLSQQRVRSQGDVSTVRGLYGIK